MTVLQPSGLLDSSMPMLGVQLSTSTVIVLLNVMTLILMMSSLLTLLTLILLRPLLCRNLLSCKREILLLRHHLLPSQRELPSPLLLLPLLPSQREFIRSQREIIRFLVLLNGQISLPTCTVFVLKVPYVATSLLYTCHS